MNCPKIKSLLKNATNYFAIISAVRSVSGFTKCVVKFGPFVTRDPLIILKI